MSQKKRKRKSSKPAIIKKNMDKTGKAIATGAGIIFSGVLLGSAINLIKKH